MTSPHHSIAVLRHAGENGLRQMLVLMLLFLVAQTRADSIEFYNGRKVQKVKILGIRDGIVFFQSGTPAKTSHARAMDIRNYHRDTETTANQVRTKTPDSSCKLLDFSPITQGKRTGYRLELQAIFPFDRVREPLVRVFCLQEDAKGERRLYLYRNQRLRDPTRTEKLPEISASDYQKKAFFLNIDDTPVAWRIEVWINGERVLGEDKLLHQDLAPTWWKTLHVARNRNLQKLDQTAEEEKSEADIPKVSCIISQCRLVKGIDRKSPEFIINWLLHSPDPRAPLPEVTLYYLTENGDGGRRISRHNCETTSGEEVAIQNWLHRTHRFSLPTTVILGGKGFDRALKGNKTKRILAWHLAVHYKDHIIAVKDSPTRNDVPKGWWRKKEK